MKELETEREKPEPDDDQITSLEHDIRALEDSYFENEREARILDVDDKNQIERIWAILTREMPLGDRLRELFKKEGITIASITRAIGLIVSTIVLAVTRITNIVAPTPTPSPKPSPGRGFVDSVKLALKKVASYIKSLAGKATASIPGLIGSVISWLFKAASQIVEVLANNVILLIIALIGLLFAVLIKQIRKGSRELSKDH